MTPPTVRGKISICWGTSLSDIHMLWTAPGDDRNFVHEEQQRPPRTVMSSYPHGSRTAWDNRWTRLWTAGDNVTRAAYCGRAHRTVHRSYTAHPHRQSPADLGGRELSPGSTAPMTTTTYLFRNLKTNHLVGDSRTP